MLNLDSFIDTSSSHRLSYISGIWYLDTDKAINYPKQGNDYYFEVEDESYWFKHRNDCIHEAIKQFSTVGLLFDIGGGNGFVAQHLESKGIQTVLIEPGKEGVKNAKRRGLKNIICSTFEKCRFNENSIPAIGVFDVVEHIQDDGDFFHNIYRILKKDGLLFITVPTYSFLWSEEDILAKHQRRYSTSVIKKVLKNCGFKITYISHFFTLLPIPILLFRTIPYLLKLKVRQTKDTRDEFRSDSPMLGKMMNILFAIERFMIKSKIGIPFGSSIIVVAKKV